MERAEDIHSLRGRVEARDKGMAASRPLDEAVKYIREKYGCDEASARNFVNWIRGTVPVSEGEAPKPPTKGTRLEKWHLRFDDETGAWIKLGTDEEEK